MRSLLAALLLLPLPAFGQEEITRPPAAFRSDSDLVTVGFSAISAHKPLENLRGG